MDKDEKYIKKRVGRRYPFTVPTGYFDTLTERVMSRIDASEFKPCSVARLSSSPASRLSGRRRYRRVMVASAASVAAAVVSVALLFGGKIDKGFSSSSSYSSASLADGSSYAADDDYAVDMADYAMMSNDQIYAYLSDE